MINRIAAYVFIFIAGISSACMGVTLFDGPERLAALLSHPESREVTYIIYAGVAAVMAALSVHASFLRAARAGERPLLYAWALGGVLASHAAYTMLVFLQVVTASRVPSLAGHINIAVSNGLVAFMLGVVPNTLLAIGSAEAALWLGGKRPAASQPA